MKRILLLTTAVCLLFASQAQNKQYAGDPNSITFVTAGTTPNAAVQSFYRDGDSWVNFTAAHGNWYVDFNEANGMPHRATGAGIATSGETVEQRAFNFIQNELSVFGIQSVDLELSQINDGKFHYIHFTQEYDGLEILWSRTTLRMTADTYKVIMFGLDVYPDVNLDINPVLTGDAAANFAVSGIDLEITGTEVLPGLKILPIKTKEASSEETIKSSYSYKLVYEVRVKTNNPEGIPGDYYTLVDAHTGAVYYRQNQVHACGSYLLEATADVQSEITDNPLVATETRGLGYIRVTIDGTFYYADENGILNLDFISEPTSATIDLRGLYSRVSQGTGDTNIESISIMLMPGDNLIAFDTESGATPSEVSAYYHQNIVHDHMKFHFPDFTDLDIQQLIRVERGDGSCNAFYDGSSTNFYEDGGGCPATALFSDVVYHEYGHGINYDLYADLGDFSGMGNGAMQEAYADIWGISITNNPILGQGFSGGTSSFVRRYDVEPKVYPADLVGQVHADGEIIAGAWWDLAENLGDDIIAMTELWVETWQAVPDGANGDEGNIYRDVLLEALLADDDNADLSDGTPNDLAIIEAFAEHGITLLANAIVDHEELELGLIAEEPIVIEADLEVDFPVYLGDFSMYYRTTPGAAWIPTALTEVTGDTYSAELPAQAAGTIIEYYFEVTDIYGGVAVIEPKEVNLADEPNLPYFALVGYAVQETEDFDEFFGDWEVDPFGTDDATTGLWEVDNPIGTSDGSYDNEPSSDNTSGSGSICAFTGSDPTAGGLGVNDVDGGATSLLSPEFDATIYEDPIFTYYRWYANDAPTSANPGNDVWQVRISNNGTDWVTVERTHTSDNSWRRNAIRISDYVTPTEQISLLFIAQDSVIPAAELTGGSLVEAAVDDLQLWGIETAPVDTTEDTTGTGNAIAELEALNGVYPNPANQFLTLSVSSSFNNGAITIVNQLGETVWQEQIVANGKQEFPISTGMLPEGVYTLVLESGGLSDRTQFVIQR